MSVMMRRSADFGSGTGRLVLKPQRLQSESDKIGSYQSGNMELPGRRFPCHIENVILSVYGRMKYSLDTESIFFYVPKYIRKRRRRTKRWR